MMSPSLFHVPDVSSFVILWDASASVLMKSKSSKMPYVISFIINFCLF